MTIAIAGFYAYGSNIRDSTGQDEVDNPPRKMKALDKDRSVDLKLVQLQDILWRSAQNQSEFSHPRQSPMQILSSVLSNDSRAKRLE